MIKGNLLTVKDFFELQVNLETSNVIWVDY